MPSFEDHFSKTAAKYAKHRPHYPAALYEFVGGLVEAHELAWDCATGQGQAALALAEVFDRVVATDASEEQLSHAFEHPRVEYRQALAEQSGLEAHSVDLVAVASAIHWFELEPFYEEVRRVAKPGAVLAAWSYRDRMLISPEIDRLITEFGSETLGPYWAKRFVHIRSQYRTLPFPFETIQAPALSAEADWQLADLVGHIQTWSGYQRFLAEAGHDPLPELIDRLRPLWGESEELVRRVEWPLHYAIGRVG